MRIRIAFALWVVIGTQSQGSAKPIERRLFSDQVEASSFDWNDWNRFQENYHPNYVADDDPKTAWTEGKKGAGVGEWIRVHHTDVDGATATRLKIRNGYQKSPDLFKKNARAKEITVKLLPDGPEKSFTLTDSSGWQEIVVSRTAGKQTGYEIKIVSVYPGTKYEDLCISDIQTFVSAETRDNPSFEKSKRDRLLSWKKQRVDAAKLFQTEAGKSLPIGAQYSFTSEGTVDYSETCGWKEPCLTKAAIDKAKKSWPARAKTLALVQTALTENFKGWDFVEVSPIDKREIPAVDGFGWSHPLDGGLPWQDEFAMPLPKQVGYFQATSLRRVYPTSGAPSLEGAQSGQDKACHQKRKGRNLMWTPRPSGSSKEAAPLSMLLVIHCGVFEDREGETNASIWQVLVYNHDGQLDSVVAPAQVMAFEWGGGPRGNLIVSGERIASVAHAKSHIKLATAPTQP